MEYAARGGSAAPRYGDLDAIAWYDSNSGDQTHEVGRKLPNAFGLFDMIGNMWEWVDAAHRDASGGPDKKILARRIVFQSCKGSAGVEPIVGNAGHAAQEHGCPLRGGLSRETTRQEACT